MATAINYTYTDINGVLHSVEGVEEVDGSSVWTDSWLVDGNSYIATGTTDVNGLSTSSWDDSIGVTHAETYIVNVDDSTLWTDTWNNADNSLYGVDTIAVNADGSSSWTGTYTDSTGTYTTSGMIDVGGNKNWTGYDEITHAETIITNDDDSKLIYNTSSDGTDLTVIVLTDGTFTSTGVYVLSNGLVLENVSTQGNVDLVTYEYINLSGTAITSSGDTVEIGIINLNDDIIFVYTITDANGIVDIINTDDNGSIMELSSINATVQTDASNYLDNTTLNYFKDGLDTGTSTLVEGGGISFDQTLDFDAVKLSDPAAYNVSVAADDAVAILRDIVFLDELVIGSAAWHAADVNNDGMIAADDAVAVLRHIVFLDEIDTFDLVDNTTGNKITSLDTNAIDVGQWSIVANGDVNGSGSFNDTYTVTADIV